MIFLIPHLPYLAIGKVRFFVSDYKLGGYTCKLRKVLRFSVNVSFCRFACQLFVALADEG